MSALYTGTDTLIPARLCITYIVPYTYRYDHPMAKLAGESSKVNNSAGPAAAIEL